MEEIIPFLAKFTPGAAGIWVLVVMGLVAWWKGLPAVIEAIANRQSKIEERLGQEMDAMSKRWEARLEQADKQHQECHAAQEVLRGRINDQDRIIAMQNETIAQQSKTMAAQNEKLTAQDIVNRQLQIALAERLDNGDESAINRAIDKLRNIQ